jgi:hypothetical protein
MRKQTRLPLREDQLAIAGDFEDAAAGPNELGMGIGSCLPDSGLQLEGAWLVASGIAEFNTYVQIGHIVNLLRRYPAEASSMQKPWE